jgi:hypothetical protein
MIRYTGQRTGLGGWQRNEKGLIGGWLSLMTGSRNGSPIPIVSPLLILRRSSFANTLEHVERSQEGREEYSCYCLYCHLP